ncbi:hypothetical protein GCM10010174_83860 [Kutzneria viridogrisea]|uniref:Uncharacterized protein n=2 Tax=Kutzneria TaxID=43356 RepID=W5WGF7_9PSEU|nr:DUF1453 family protein [Kutzneria albida]AHI00279.1 hypothetical protein KALB_6920 [Kutzneria albida DSM 43870]MBA8925457.1 hypothetical protein [Kutzneria viridogrisea]
MSSLNLVPAILIGAFVVIRVIGKQVVGAPVTQRSLVLMPAILVAIGLFSASTAMSTASAGELGFFAVDVLLLIGLGAARGASTRLSIRDGGLYQKGSPLTLVLWLSTIAVRVGAGFLAAALGVSGTLTTASMLLTFGLSIGVQNLMVFYRAQQLRMPLAARRA